MEFSCPAIAPTTSPPSMGLTPKSSRSPQARERSRKLQIARSIRQGTYKPDLDALASTLLKKGLTQDLTTGD